MPFDPATFEAEVALKLIPTEQLPSVAQDALEAGFDGPHVLRMAILEPMAGWAIDQALPPMLEELELHSIAPEEAALRLARQRAQHLLETGEERRGQTTLYDAHGAVRTRIDLGDASEDLQTTPDGLIWVSYFDEGVFGGGIGRQGLVCYDAAGKPIFKYADFAEQNALLIICDCYALNVDQTGAVWVNYYMDFPLVKLCDGQVEQLWKDFGVLGNAFAVRGQEVIGMHDKQLTIRDLSASSQQESTLANAVDEGGNLLEPTTQRYADVAGRGAFLVLNTGHAIYELCG